MRTLVVGVVGMCVLSSSALAAHWTPVAPHGQVKLAHGANAAPAPTIPLISPNLVGTPSAAEPVITNVFGVAGSGDSKFDLHNAHFVQVNANGTETPVVDGGIAAGAPKKNNDTDFSDQVFGFNPMDPSEGTAAGPSLAVVPVPAPVALAALGVIVVTASRKKLMQLVRG